MKKTLLSVAVLALVPAGDVFSQSVYFGSACYPVRRPAFSLGWSGGPWQFAASWGGGWGGGYAATSCAPYVRSAPVPVWTTGYDCYPAPVVSYYGTSHRPSSAFVVPRRYGAAPIVADPVFRPPSPFYPLRVAR